MDLTSLNTRIKYHFKFLVHCKNKSLHSHKVTREDLKLKQIIMENYYKSLLIGNAMALYLNYVRRNKSFVKSLASKI